MHRGGENVDHTGRIAAPYAGGNPGAGKNQGDANQVVVEPLPVEKQPVPAEVLAVVAGDHDDRVVGVAAHGKSLESPADEIVLVGDRRQIPGPQVEERAFVCAAVLVVLHVPVNGFGVRVGLELHPHRLRPRHRHLVRVVWLQEVDERQPRLGGRGIVGEP